MKKHLLLLFTCGALALPQANASVIYGYQAFEPAVAKPFRGPICFDSATPNQPTHIADCSSANIVYSGYYINYFTIISQRHNARLLSFYFTCRCDIIITV